MDEIEWIKTIKKVIVMMTKVFVGVAIFLSVLMLIANDKRDITEIYLLIILIIGVGFPAVLGINYCIISIINKIINSGRKVINFDNNYIRELPKVYTPAISSFIYDLKIDIYKDYTATILHLCNKKYIDMEKNGENYSFKQGNQKDFSNLGRCEKYILDIIINKKDFNASQFKQEIIKEAQEKSLITDKMYSKKAKEVLIFLIGFILLIITYKINIILFSIYMAIVLPIVYIYCVLRKAGRIKNTEYFRTDKGKEAARILAGVKKYIKEYTLIKEKNIDYIQILGDYIPYAIALDEADTIEEFIKYNEQYRNLIYNKQVDKC